MRNTCNKNSTYKGINTVLLKDGLRFEMQYHTQDSFDLKNGALHILYENARDEMIEADKKK